MLCSCMARVYQLRAGYECYLDYPGGRGASGMLELERGDKSGRTCRLGTDEPDL